MWKESGIDEALHRILNRGSMVFASAAAMGMGSYVMPVYEMYRAGHEPHWLEGINLLEAATGINAAIVAHYNNTQGGTHDTRFCFVGERRMKQLDVLLPHGVGVLGIDEHTGIAFDLDEKSVETFGKGEVTARVGGSEIKFPPKSSLHLDEFKSAFKL
jgi:cyanophycinase-like exopeptidase